MSLLSLIEHDPKTDEYDGVEIAEKEDKLIGLAVDLASRNPSRRYIIAQHIRSCGVSPITGKIEWIEGLTG